LPASRQRELLSGNHERERVSLPLDYPAAKNSIEIRPLSLFSFRDPA